MKWRQKGVQDCQLLDCKDFFVDLNQVNSDYEQKIVMQRSVSYFKSLHSTTALEGLGHPLLTLLIQPSYVATSCSAT